MRRSRPRQRSSHSRHPVHPEQLEPRQLFAAFIAGNPTAYATIQAAVDAAAPGATINVDAGVYPEWVYVDKKLTLRGAQAGVDGRSNARANNAVAETVLTGIDLGTSRSGAFHIVASNVTLDGFTVQGNTNGSVATGAGITLAPKISGTRLLNNVVQYNVTGIYLSNSSTTNPCVIQRNLFRFNNNAGVNSGRAVYSDEYISGGNLTNVTIDSNAFIRNFGGTGTTTVESAISFESYTANTQSDLRITNNVFDGNGKSVLAWNASGILIENNVASYNKDQWSGVFRFEGNVHDVTIRSNNVYGNQGPAIRIDNKAASGDNYNFSVTNNNFYANDTVYTRNAIELAAGQYSGTLDARNNWWGASGGPGSPGADTYVAAGNTMLVSPWATAPVVQRQSPFYGLPASAGAKIEAEDFDHGGEAIAYHDTDGVNAGGQWRNMQSVDVEKTTDTGGGYNVNTTRTGEWIAYTINLADSGTYSIDFRLASAQTTGGAFHVEIDGVNVTGSIVAPNTGGWQTWTTLTKSGLNLSAGNHVLKIVFDTNGSGGSGASLNWLKLIATSVTPPPAPTAPSAPTGLIATLNSATQATLTWADNSNNETGFTIERRIGAGAWQVMTTTAANVTTSLDANLAASTSYTYRVYATNAVGPSGYSNEATVTTPAPNPPPQQTTVYLSDLTWLSATNGWGPVEKDMSVGGSGAGDGAAITLNGVTYAKGLGVHAPSEIIYDLSGQYAQFTSDIGVDDRQTTNGTVVFQVYADGVLVFNSGVMTATSATKTVTLDVTGVQQLKLVVNDGGDGIDYDHADWAGARLLTATNPTPPPPVPGPTVPAAPSNLKATAISSSQIALTWTDNATDETGYNVWRSTDGVTWTLAKSLGPDTTSWTDTNRTRNKTYFYKVTAINSSGESPASNISSATTFRR